jgi:TolB-like protein/DNA-binding SARP family transcriptional activator/lipoprotein NlpI
MYSLRLLGGISLAGPSGPLSGRVVQHRQLAVLALLAMAREKGCSRDKLAGYLWPESPEERARHLLADSIYLLRKSLGDIVVGTSGDVLRLNPDVIRADAVEFQENLERGDLEAAVALYGGPFLDGFFADGAPEFEHWVEAARRDLADRCATALEALAADAEESGDPTLAAVWWRRLAAHDPYNSRVTLRLMQALVAAGDPANALQAAQEHEANLKEQLELDPPPELASYVERLRNGTLEGEPALDAATPTPTTAPSPETIAAKPITARDIVGLVRKHRLAAAGLATLAILLIAVLARQLLTSRATRADRVSIAVLPFQNLTGDPENDYIAAGFHEEVISQLTKLGGVRVIARSSVMEYGDNPRNLRIVAEELGVDHILEASLRAEGERLRITAQLIEPESSGHLWAESYDRARGDLLDVQLDIALGIAESLRAQLTPEELARIEFRPTENQEAYDYYLRGLTFETNFKLLQAEQMYERAVELDPDFAVAFARLGYVSTHLVFAWGHLEAERYSNAERLSNARTAIERALEIEPDLFEGHIARHYYFAGPLREYDAALEALERARQLRPGDAEVYRRLGLVMRRMGRFEEAVQYFERALELSPRYRSLLINAATTAIWMRDFERAQHYIDRGFAISPDDGTLHLYQALLHVNWTGSEDSAWQAYGRWAESKRTSVPREVLFHWRAVWRSLHDHYREPMRQHTLATFGTDTLEYYYLKALSYLTTGELDLARAYSDSGRVVEEAVLQQVPRDTPFGERRYRSNELAILYAGSGRTADAVRVAREGVELLPVSRDAIEGPMRLMTLAEVYAICGEYDAAIDVLERLLSIPSATSAMQLWLDPIWDPLRDNPRFQDLIERYGGREGPG